MKVAILTGASSGLGAEYFNCLQNEHNLDEIWLVARRIDRLEKLAENAKIKTVPISLDLLDRNAVGVIEDKIKAENAEVSILINNAGFGLLGNAWELSADRQRDMVELNDGALTALCVTLIKYMKKGAYIINVSSIASFAPNPRMAVYSSTKAYVTSFTKCLREELKVLGINALHVCPGPMKTEFLEKAGIVGNSKAFETLPYCDAEKVAKKSLAAAKKGKSNYTPLFTYKLYRVVARIVPHGIVMKFAKT